MYWDRCIGTKLECNHHGMGLVRGKRQMCLATASACSAFVDLWKVINKEKATEREKIKDAERG